eukprot:g30977.t1
MGLKLQRSQLRGGGDSTNILNDGRAQHISAKDKAEAFAAIFSQKCRVNDPSLPPPMVPSTTDTGLQPICFTPCDIKKRLETLDTTKGTGPDNIPTIVLKTCSPEPSASQPSCFRIATTLVSTRHCGKLPKYVLYTKSRTNPKPANYHPIILFSIISKVMEDVINSAIKQHLLGNAWFGFHQGHSAPDLLTALAQTWTKELNSRGE